MEEDIPRILEIEQEAISPPWTHGAFLSELYNKDSYFSLAVDPGSRIIGFVVLRKIADESELLKIAVDKAHRRQGVADSLLSAALDWARARGSGSIFLEVRESNAAAIGLYKKHGFFSAGVRRNYYTEPVENAIIMKRKT